MLKQAKNILTNLRVNNKFLCSNGKESNGQTKRIKQKLPYFTQLQSKQLMSQQNPLRNIILESVEQFGQMKLDRYWKTALTDTQFGYYSKNNVFSKQGDFTTSPEISSLFGQMIAIWIMTFLTKIGVIDGNTNTVTKKFRLVQLGPGRGFLMRDIIKSLHQMKIQNYFQIVMVEVSQFNRKSQQDKIFEQFKKYDEFFRFQFQNQTKQIEEFTNENQHRDIKLKWYQNVELLVKNDHDIIQNKGQLPTTIFLMNQFFDALPVNILQYTEKGWRQKVIGKSNNPQFELSLKNSTYPLNQKMTPLIQNPQIGETIQVSNQSLITMDTLAKLILHSKGAILNIDYGAQSCFSNSIRAIKNHKFIPSPYFWNLPGKCDLSGYVNFAALAQFAQSNAGVRAFEAIPQGFFLQAMGINPRIDILQKNMSEEQKQKLESQYHRLTHPEQMGEMFKVQCITLKQYGQIYPWITEKDGVY